MGHQKDAMILDATAGEGAGGIDRLLLRAVDRVEDTLSAENDAARVGRAALDGVLAVYQRTPFRAQRCPR